MEFDQYLLPFDQEPDRLVLRNSLLDIALFDVQDERRARNFAVGLLYPLCLRELVDVEDHFYQVVDSVSVDPP